MLDWVMGATSCPEVSPGDHQHLWQALRELASRSAFVANGCLKSSTNSISPPHQNPANTIFPTGNAGTDFLDDA